MKKKAFYLLVIFIATLAGTIGGSLSAQTFSRSSFSASESVNASSNLSELTNKELAKVMAETPKIQEVSLAPDGMAVAYSILRGSVDSNENAIELLVQRLDAGGAPKGDVIRVERRVSDRHPGGFGIGWCPDSKCITYFTAKRTSENGSAHLSEEAKSAPDASKATLVRYFLASGAISPILIRDTEPLKAGPRGTRPRINSVPGGRWSPLGTHLAFIAPLEPGGRRLNKRGGTLETANLDVWFPQARKGLFVLDVATGAFEQVSPNELSVTDFDWSPDGRSFVVEATRGSNYVELYWTDLYVVDRASCTARPLVVQPGTDGNPTWSPDGKWIAFASQKGVPSTYAGGPAIIAATGGPITQLARDDDPIWGFNDRGFWRADSQGFYYKTGYHMIYTLAYADIKSKHLSLLDSSEHYNDWQHSFSADRRRVVFARQTLAEPPEIYVQSLPEGEPRKVTAINAAFPLADKLRVDRVSWRSHDGKLTIHGLLLTPRSAWDSGGERMKSPLPTVVFNIGGPSMVSNSFDAGYGGLQMFPLAVRRYAVLFPNGRTRHGYGPALVKSGSYMRLPHEDVMTGVDKLVQMGVADPERLGVSGHSYGAWLTTFQITQTDRFKAALIHEGDDIDRMPGHIRPPGSDGDVRQREQYGIPDLTDPAYRDRIIAENPLFHASRITTPTMLQYGGIGNGSAANGRDIFMVLERLKIPNEFLIYDEGHGPVRPAAVADEIVRTADWFDYWLRDMPYPDKEREKQYNAWKAKRAAEKQNTAGSAVKTQK